MSSPLARQSKERTRPGRGIGSARHVDQKYRKQFGLADDEHHVDDFSCALYRGWLRQGTLTITTRHLCFCSAFLRGGGKLVINFNDIDDVRKRSTVLYPIALTISSKGEDYLFASFLWRSREALVALIEARRRIPHGGGAALEQSLRRAATLPRPSGSLSSADANEWAPSGAGGGGGGAWPVVSEPPPRPEAQGQGTAYTEIMDLHLRGWSVGDVATVLDDGNDFFHEWHKRMNSKDVTLTPWRMDTTSGKRARRATFVAKVQDGGRFGKGGVECEQLQTACLHTDGTFALHIVQTVPSLKNVANFEVQFVWLLAPEGSDTAARVYVRVVFHGAAWGVGGIIKNNSVSQSVTSYGTLRQILLERFPMQGGTSLRRGAAAEAQDVEYALKLARTAASRMPGDWEIHLHASLEARDPEHQTHAYQELLRWSWSVAALSIAAVAVMYVLLHWRQGAQLRVNAAPRLSDSAFSSAWQAGVPERPAACIVPPPCVDVNCTEGAWREGHAAPCVTAPAAPEKGAGADAFSKADKAPRRRTGSGAKRREDEEERDEADMSTKAASVTEELAALRALLVAAERRAQAKAS